MTIREKVANELASIMQGLPNPFLEDSPYKDNKLEQADRIIALLDEEWMEVQAKLTDAVRERDHYQRTVARMDEELDHLQSREREAQRLMDTLVAYGMIHTVTGVMGPGGTHAAVILEARAWLAGAAPAQTEGDEGTSYASDQTWHDMGR